MGLLGFLRRAVGATARLTGGFLLVCLAFGLALYVPLGFELPPGVDGRHIAFLATVLATLAILRWRRRRRESPRETSARTSLATRGLLLLLTLAVIEIGLRSVMGNSATSRIREPDDNCRLKPGTEVDYTGWLLRIPPVRMTVNSMGYRGAERPEEKPDAALRILLVGDSSTMGQGLPDDATIAVRLEAALDEQSLRPVEVLNFGIDGLNVEDVFKRYDGFASRWEHDIMLYLMNQNDLDAATCEAPTWFAEALFRNVYVVRLPLMVTFFSLALIELTDVIEPDRAAENARLIAGIERLAAEARSNGAGFGVAMIGIPWRLSEDWADRVDVPLLDMAYIERDRSNVIPWEGHYNERGSQLAADAIAAWLPEALPSTSLQNPTTTRPGSSAGK